MHFILSVSGQISEFVGILEERAHVFSEGKLAKGKTKSILLFFLSLGTAIAPV